MPVLLDEREKSGVPEPAENKKKRVELLDLLRGFSMIYVMLYHLLFDMVYFAGVNVPFWGSVWFEAAHEFFLCVLFLVSGICTAFSRDPVKRGAALFLLGGLLTLFTDMFMPLERIVFGVLSFFGAMMVITGLARPLIGKADPFVMAAVCALLFYMFFDFVNVPGTVHLIFADAHIPLPEDRQYLYPIGIMSRDFFSADYFPLIPHGFVYLAGAALAKPFRERRLPEIFYADARISPVNFIGKHSLAFYIVHQPVFMGAAFLFLKINGG